MFATVLSVSYYLNSGYIVSLYINDEPLQIFIQSSVWIMCINTLPEVLKGYLKGVFKAFAM